MIYSLLGVIIGLIIGFPLGFLLQRKRFFEVEFKNGFETASRFYEGFKSSQTTFSNSFGPSPKD